MRDLKSEFGEMECPQCGELRDYPFLKCPNEQCSWRAKIPITIDTQERVRGQFMDDHPAIKRYVETMRREARGMRRETRGE